MPTQKIVTATENFNIFLVYFNLCQVIKEPALVSTKRQSLFDVIVAGNMNAVINSGCKISLDIPDNELIFFLLRFPSSVIAVFFLNL